jgi:glutathione S-transferase
VVTAFAGSPRRGFCAILSASISRASQRAGGTQAGAGDMLTLYHGDTAVCAAKVRMTLAEKGLEWQSMPVDLSRGQQFDPAYMKLNPNAVVPTLVDDGTVIIESTVINEYLDERFPTPALRPATPQGRARLRLWTKREDGIHDAINTVTSAILFRAEELKKTPEARAARVDRMPDPAKREKWVAIIDKGLDAGYVMTALVRFARHFRDMEAALANGPWLLGEEFSLADSGLVSFFYRLEMLEMAGMWQDHFPRVADWFTRCKARPSFVSAILTPIPEARRAHYHEIAAPTWPKVAEIYARALAQI